jgi:DNA repair exonuclease SbcCD ATPase subunit
MKEIKLINLKLQNFKGVKSFELNADGQDIKIFGENGTGKTTLFDAFVWLLFDKDSQNQKDFGIKTLVDGEVQHNLNHEVEATLSVDGVDLTLKKVYAEKWTKKRGSATAEHTGHTTDHFVNGVPCNKTEFTKKIAEIVSEDVFKLLTSPSYFNEQLHWTKRRDLLLEIAGDISNDDVLATDEKLKVLKEQLTKHSIDDLKKMIASKRKEINKQLDDIPIRIDEISRNKSDTGVLKKGDINTQIEQLNNDIELKTDNLNDLRNGSEVNKIKKELSDIELKLSQVKNRHEQDNLADVYKLKSRLQEEQSNLSILKSKATNEMQRATDTEYNIKIIKEDMTKLRAKWSEINAQELQHEDKCECPTCKQPIPQEQLDEAREKAESDFNAWKSTELESIQKQGVSNKERVATLEKELESINKNVDKIKSQIEDKEKVVAKLEKELADKQEKATPIEENEEYQQLIATKSELNDKISRINESIDKEVAKEKKEIESLRKERNSYQAEILKFEQRDRDIKRIAELEAEQKELAKAFEEQEALLFATEEFTRKKVELLEDKINSKFKHARFKLFDEQINGGLQETCVTLFDGVPYDKGLNNAAKINVGLDVIDTLSKHYGVRAVIFVDNAEAVTKLLDIDSQIISLVVSEKDKTLRIEKQEE